MLSDLTRNWWMLVVRGGVIMLLGVLFGLAAFFQPALTLTLLIPIFGALAVADGVHMMVVEAVLRPGRRGLHGSLILGGLASTVAGLLTLLWPQLTVHTLLYWIAGWAIVAGVAMIWGVGELRRFLPNEWRLLASGILAVVFGVTIGLMAFLNPAAGVLSLVWLISLYALVYGGLLLALGLRLQTLQEPGLQPMRAPGPRSVAR